MRLNSSFLERFIGGKSSGQTGFFVFEDIASTGLICVCVFFEEGGKRGRRKLSLSELILVCLFPRVSENYLLNFSLLGQKRNKILDN